MRPFFIYSASIGMLSCEDGDKSVRLYMDQEIFRGVFLCLRLQF